MQKHREEQFSSTLSSDKESLKRFFWVPFIWSVTGLLFAICSLWLYVLPSEQSRQQEQLAKVESQHIANIIEQELANTQQQIDLLSHSPDIQKFLLLDNRRELSRLSQQYLELMPVYVERIRIIAKNKAELEPKGKGPLTFTGLDMITRAESGADIAPEAYRAENQWYINIITTVKQPSSERISGVVLATLSATAFAKSLETRIPLSGYITLYAGMATQESVAPHKHIIQMFEEPTKETNTYTQALGISPWTLSYQPTQPSQSSVSTTLIQPISLLLITAAFFGIAAWFNVTVFRKELQINMDRFIGYAHKRKNTPHHPIPEFTIGFFNRLIEPLKPVLNVEKEPENSDAHLTATQAPLNNSVKNQKSATSSTAATPSQHYGKIFRGYDVFGTYPQQLNEACMKALGLAFGSTSQLQAGERKVIVGHDGRTSSPALKKALITGLQASGCNVVDIGQVPTPLLYFAIEFLKCGSAVMITGSHHGSAFNGAKMFLEGTPVLHNTMKTLQSRMDSNDFLQGQGRVETLYLDDEYIERILSDIAIAKSMKIVLDCSNGVAGDIAPRLFHSLGCEVVTLNGKVDGTFPAHTPDPSDYRHLHALREKVVSENADLGVAYDGDANRLQVVTNEGTIINTDRLLMLLAKDVLVKNPGADIIYDVKCSRRVSEIIRENGGMPMMWKSGQPLMFEKIKSTRALLGGELSGHIYFADRWSGFEDALYCTARLLEIIGFEMHTTEEVFASLPHDISTPELSIDVDDNEKKHQLIDHLATHGKFDSGNISTVDGLRVDFPDGWGLIRASNSSSSLTLRFEAESDAALSSIQKLFKSQLLAVDENLKLPI